MKIIILNVKYHNISYCLLTYVHLFGLQRLLSFSSMYNSLYLIIAYEDFYKLLTSSLSKSYVYGIGNNIWLLVFFIYGHALEELKLKYN